jgi:hypothetical protein
VSNVAADACAEGKSTIAHKVNSSVERDFMACLRGGIGGSAILQAGAGPHHVV